MLNEIAAPRKANMLKRNHRCNYNVNVSTFFEELFQYFIIKPLFKVKQCVINIFI